MSGVPNQFHIKIAREKDYENFHLIRHVFSYAGEQLNPTAFKIYTTIFTHNALEEFDLSLSYLQQFISSLKRSAYHVAIRELRENGYFIEKGNYGASKLVFFYDWPYNKIPQLSNLPNSFNATQVQEENLLLDGGIYSITYNNQLLYIGKTSKSFEERWNQHKLGIKQKTDELPLYTYCRLQNIKVEDLQFNIVFSCKTCPLTSTQLDNFETSYINSLQPLCNVNKINKLDNEIKICESLNLETVDSDLYRLSHYNNLYALLMYLYANMKNKNTFDIPIEQYVKILNLKEETVKAYINSIIPLQLTPIT